MTSVADRPCLREQIAVDVNAASLAPGEEAAALRTVDRLGALGIAGGRTLASRLSAALWRLRGRDHRARPEAALLFCAYLRTRREVQDRWRAKEWSVLLARFSAIVVVEWEHEICQTCGTAGSVAMVANRRHSRGWRNYCHDCGGTGRRPADHGDRAQLLGVTHQVYDKHWRSRFGEAAAWLRELEGTIQGDLRKLLSRRIVRSEHE